MGPELRWGSFSLLAMRCFAVTAGLALVKVPFHMCRCVSCWVSQVLPGEGKGLEGGWFLLSLLPSPDSCFPLGSVHESPSGFTIELTLISIQFFHSALAKETFDAC